MSKFGWSLPPGCGELPDEARGDALELTHLVLPLQNASAVFWDENGRIIEVFPQQVPADECAGTPEYTDSAERVVGQVDWSDELSEAENIRRAAEHYKRTSGGL